MSGGRVRVEAPAKLNLHLAVGALADDGYHPVRTLMVALDGLSDTVDVTPAPARRVRCPGVAERHNLAWRALDALEAHIGRALGCEVEITKRIPAQAGLGGGSSDAAATLVAANRAFALGLGADVLETVAAAVGSDVAFFVRGGAQWATGRGEVLRAAASPTFHGLVAHPGGGLSTPAVYRAFDTLPAAAFPGPEPGPDLDGLLRNDLWPAARRLMPGLDDLDRALRHAGAHRTILCGSGSAMVGFFADRAAAERARSIVPGALAVVGPAAQRDLHTRWDEPSPV